MGLTWEMVIFKYAMKSNMIIIMIKIKIMIMMIVVK